MNKNLRVLAWAAYAVALLLIVLPFVDILVTVLPVRLGEVQWRFGVAGLVANGLTLPLAGVLLVLATAAASGHRLVARIFAVLSLVGALVGVVGLIMLTLDMIELRNQVRVETLPRFDAAGIGAIVKYSLGVVTALLLGVGGWKAARRVPPGATSRGAGTRETAEDTGVLLSSRGS